ncbi:MAG: hypothetical protein GTN99_07030 [Candidatus Dadabacteria bacterium]|nr:hypothetical protein [Candidatus Dadabacteria bacterium]
MDKIVLEFGEFTPDQPDAKSAVTMVDNVVPNQLGYTSLASEAQISDAINARARGAYAARDSSGTVYNYVGNETKLYSLSSNTHTDVTRSNGAYTTGSTEFWEFQKFGDDLYATNFTDLFQKITLGGTNFADVTAAPKARHASLINNFMVLGNLDESGTLTPNKVKWSAINDPTTWAITTANQAGEQVLYSTAKNGGGFIQKVVGGEEGLILQEYSIWRMQYVGGQELFLFDEIAPGIGTPARNSVIDLGEQVFFLGQDGFYKVVNSASIEPIGESKVDRWFFDDVDDENIDRVIGAADNAKRIVAWIYPDGNSPDGTPNKMILYNWAIGKWSTASVDAHWIYAGLGESTTTEDLDSQFATVDSASTQLVDAREFLGGTLQLAVYDTNHKKASFSGSARAATIDTVEGQFGPGRFHITGVRPLIEGTGCTITGAVGYRDNLNNESVTFTSDASPESDTNICPQRIDARYAKARIKTSGEFDFAVGAEIFGVASGVR